MEVIFLEKLIYTNALGKTIELSTASNYILKTIDGVAGIDLNIQSSKSYNQDGDNYQGNTLNPRFIDVEIMIIAKSKEDMAKKRQQIVSILNPKLDLGKIEYHYGGTKKTIDALPEKSPEFVTKTWEKDYMMETGITFYCPNPYWQNPTENKAEIAIWRPAFEFALEIVEEGIEMGYREPSLIVNVFNGGDVKTGMKIKFRALGTLVNPQLFNVNTREYIKVNATMQRGDVITINTNDFNKRIERERNGEFINFFNWLDLRSRFLQLAPGDNLFRYNADDGLDNLEVDIYYNQKVLGV